MKSRQVRSTEAHFEEYRRWCEFWKIEFGCGEWIMYVRWERMSGIADCFVNETNKEFTLRFKKGLIPREIIENLKWYAFHEVGEKVLWKIGSMAEKGRAYPENEVTDERHAILNIWENMMRKHLKEER